MKHCFVCVWCVCVGIFLLSQTVTCDFDKIHNTLLGGSSPFPSQLGEIGGGLILFGWAWVPCPTPI